MAAEVLPVPQQPRRAKVTVTYEDGSTEEFNPNRPRLLLDLEKRFNVQAPERHEQVMWMAYHALREIPGKDQPFEEWVESLDDIDAVPAGGASGEGQTSSTG